MTLPELPNEIFAQVLRLLSFEDKKESMLICHTWYTRFQSTVFHSIYIYTRRQFRQLLSKLQYAYEEQENSFGMLIRRLTLGSRVGIVNAEFNKLPLYCPYLEYFDFDRLLWRYVTYSDNLLLWCHLKRFPCMQRLALTLPILRDTGQNITQLEMGSVMVDQLASTKFTIFSILTFTPNLLSLKLSNGIMVSQSVSIYEFESIHTLCPQLEALALESFDARFPLTDSYLIDIDTLPIATQLKTLHLYMSISSEEFLVYWAHKYPSIEQLDIQLRLSEPEYYHEAVQPGNSTMKESFAQMATRFTKLKILQAHFDEKYLPCDVFLGGLNSIGTKLQDVSIHFHNFDYHRRNARNFKLLINNSIETMAHVKISNWDRSWDYEQDILEPMNRCTVLESLSLSPQPGTLTEFDVDIILDECLQLKRLELGNTYNLFIRDIGNRRIGNIHQLEELVLKHTMVNNILFDYLAARCPLLNRLDLQHVAKPYDNDIQLKIFMPNHDFKSINIQRLQLGLRIEDSGFQCNCSSTICSLEETLKTQQVFHRMCKAPTCFYPASRSLSRYPERWYHLYQPKGSRQEKCFGGKEIKIGPRLQRLNDDNIQKIKNINVTKELWEQLSFAGARLKFESKNKWELDIPFGYSSVVCRSVEDFRFEGVSL